MDRIEAAAAACQEANRFYCLATGDDSQPTWADAPDWQKESVMLGVQAIVDDPKITPEQSHENWLQLKRDGGWVYGEKKDPEAKTHPCMVAYDKLPRDQQMKDHIFQSVARAILQALNQKERAPYTVLK